MKLTRDRRLMLSAIASALAWEASYAEAHHDSLTNRPMKGYARVVSRSRERTRKLKRLAAKLQSGAVV